MDECDYTRVEKLIADGDVEAAQAELDKAEVRTAQWHFLQSKVFFAKNWVFESKKQMEIALQLEPDNAQYIEEMERLNALGDVPPQTEKQEQPELDKGTCKDSCAECCAQGCCYCMCEAICEGLGDGC